MMNEHIRISDAERDQVTARLREHFAEGRLDSDELEERITTTLRAKTYGDLRGILSDLPEPELAGRRGLAVPPGRETSGWQAPGMQTPWVSRPVYYRRGPRLLPLMLLVMFTALIMPWAAVAFLKIALLVWLVVFVTSVIATARFGGRRSRRALRSGYLTPGQSHGHAGWRR